MVKITVDDDSLPSFTYLSTAKNKAQDRLNNFFKNLLKGYIVCILKILYNIPSMQNLKWNETNALLYKTGLQRIYLWLPKREE